MRNEPLSRFQSLEISHLVMLAGAIIAMVIASAFFGLTVKQDEMIRNYIEIAARNYFDSIVITRRWNAGYDGVYVFKKEGMVSNPYLKKPDITTQDGRVYTMKNPALMTREISEMARKNGGYRYHITSLKLMNPANVADEWEKASLVRFENGAAETSLITEEAGEKVFRLMRPLFFEAGCISCHGQQGYKEGDVRGGISVTLPYDEIAVSLQRNRVQMLGLAALILACFVAVFYLGVWRLFSRLAATNALLAEEREKLGQMNAELDRKVEERSVELLAVNQQLEVLNKLTRRAIKSHSRKEVVQVALDGVVMACAPDLALFYTIADDWLILQGAFPAEEEHIVEKKKVGMCLCGLAAEQGVSVFSEDIHCDARCTLNECKEAGIRSFAALPIMHNHVVMGVLGIASKAEKKYSAEREFLETLAATVGIVLQNALMIEKIRNESGLLEQKVAERTRELEEKNEELQRFNKLFVDREFRIKELRDQVAELQDKVTGGKGGGQTA